VVGLVRKDPERGPCLLLIGNVLQGILTIRIGIVRYPYRGTVLVPHRSRIFFSSRHEIGNIVPGLVHCKRTLSTVKVKESHQGRVYHKAIPSIAPVDAHVHHKFFFRSVSVPKSYLI
jgi:hypothetical protein